MNAFLYGFLDELEKCGLEGKSLGRSGPGKDPIFRANMVDEITSYRPGPLRRSMTAGLRGAFSGKPSPESAQEGLTGPGLASMRKQFRRTALKQLRKERDRGISRGSVGVVAKRIRVAERFAKD